MTQTQTRILELMASLSVDERRAVIARAQDSGLLGDTFLARMTPEQRGELDAAIEEANRDEGASEDEIFARLEQRFGVDLKCE